MSNQIASLYEIFKQHPTVTIDSRHITEGCIFFALKGEKLDGNIFAEQALRQGAAHCVIDDVRYQVSEKCFLVKNVLATLQDLAKHHRQQFDIPVLGITGSNGKTTTKELISSLLSIHYRTHATAGNFNNHIGVPLTLLSMPANTEIAVVEMGANHVGEIDFLCQLAAPTHGLITNVGKAHLEGFGGEEGVRRGKSEMYRYLASHKGIAFVNMNENFLTALSEVVGRKRLFYTRSEKLDAHNIPFEVEKCEENPFLTIRFLSERQEIVTAHSQLSGDYNFNNLLTAVVVGKYFKVPAQKIKYAVENYLPKNNRSEWLEHGKNRFLMDAYNANPTSMTAAITAFAKNEASSKMIVLGGMKEMGDYSEQEHESILQTAMQLFDKHAIILVGREFEAAARAAGVEYFEDVQLLKDWFVLQNLAQKTVLLKGSRGIGLEFLVKE